MESIWAIRQVRIKPEKLLYILFIENKRLSPIIFSFKVPLWLGPEYWDIFDSEQFAGNSNLTIGVLTMLKSKGQNWSQKEFSWAKGKVLKSL